MKSQRLRSRFSPKKELYFYKTQMTVDLKVIKDSSLLCKRLCYYCLHWTMYTSSSVLSQLLKLLSSVFYHFSPSCFPLLCDRKKSPQFCPWAWMWRLFYACLELRKFHAHCGAIVSSSFSSVLPFHQRPC